ncbi:hypothetical protein KEM48_002358 [Puccinia striiformis f. sp. tritici PST-130]|nr:hypothetical protein KEM48_002358 [Puccinia striiformis f. sp. tritici PST-130]
MLGLSASQGGRATAGSNQHNWRDMDQHNGTSKHHPAHSLSTIKRARRTIALVLSLYQRFHLFFPFSEFNLHDVLIAAVWLASKLEDTLKKLMEIQLAARLA